MRRFVLLLVVLLLTVGNLQADGCPYECKSYANGDKFCWEFLSGRKGYMYECEVVAHCWSWVDGTTYCEMQCDGAQCYIA
jgi:hypothetical protein